MKIAIIGNLPGPISLDGPGGSEVFVYNLIKKLIEKGFKTTLFASSDSEFKQQQIPFFTSTEIGEKNNLSPGHLQNKITVYKNALFSKVIELGNSFDLIHNNIYETFLFFPFSRLIKTPVIHTVHNIFFEDQNFQQIAKRFIPKKDALVFVSESAMKRAKLKGNKTFIYNGIDINRFKFDEKGNHTITWMSRAVPKKGLEQAIKVANSLQKKINIISKATSVQEKAFLSQMTDKIKTDFNLFRNSSLKSRVQVLQKSKVFILPIQWEEPFGLVTVEAMACGAPVVAYSRGAMPEIVKDGKTGFIINPSDNDIRGNWIIKKTGLEGLMEGVRRIYSLPQKEYLKMRQNSYFRVKENFSIKTMADNYEKVYYKLLKSQ